MLDTDRGRQMNNEGMGGRPPVMTTTTTSTTTTSPAYSLDWIKLDIEYFKTLPGIIKLVQWVWSFAY